MLKGLQTIWSLPEGIKMNEILTIEQVMEIGEASKRILLENLSPEDWIRFWLICHKPMQKNLMTNRRFDR